MQRFLSSLPRALLASYSALPAKASKSMPAGDASMTRTVASSSYTSSRSRSKYASSGLALRAAAISSAMETRSPRTSRTVKAFSVDLYHQLFFRQGVPEHHP